MTDLIFNVTNDVNAGEYHVIRAVTRESILAHLTEVYMLSIDDAKDYVLAVDVFTVEGEQAQECILPTGAKLYLSKRGFTYRLRVTPARKI